VTIDRFIEDRRARWARLGQLVSAARGRVARLSADDVVELGRLYRITTSDLAIALYSEAPTSGRPRRSRASTASTFVSAAYASRITVDKAKKPRFARAKLVLQSVPTRDAKQRNQRHGHDEKTDHDGHGRASKRSVCAKAGGHEDDADGNTGGRLGYERTAHPDEAGEALQQAQPEREQQREEESEVE
jgi:hypothetical protein